MRVHMFLLKQTDNRKHTCLLPGTLLPLAAGLDQAFLQQPVGRAGALQRLSRRLEVQTGGRSSAAQQLQTACRRCQFTSY